MKRILGYVLAVFMVILFTRFTINSSNGGNNAVTSETQKVQHKKTQSNQGYYYAKLSGKNVVPPVKTNASGEAMFQFSKDGKKMTYSIKLSHINAVTMAHIHHAAKGKNGPIAVWLYKGKPMSIVKGFLSHGTITNKDIKTKGVTLEKVRKWMNEGDACVIVHTKAHPAGEIRGHIYHANKSSKK